MSVVTPRQLSVELGVPEDEVLRFLKRYFRITPELAYSRQISDEQLAAVRNKFRAPGTAELPWLIEGGETRPRREIHGLYGGQEQGGISTPRDSRNILVFTDPEVGRRHGYDKFEGLREDGSYAYTGEGQWGDQAFGVGNSALRDVAVNGSVVRLFRTHGRLATYVGTFTTSVPTFHFETIPDSNRQPRTGIIFNLVPLDAMTELLPAFGGELDDLASIYDSQPQPLTWSPPDFSDIVVPGREGETREDRVVSRIEFQLQRTFGEWMQQRGDRPSRLRLRAGSTMIEPDFYFESRGWIVEAKQSTARGYVREAVGQVLDYVNVARRSGLDAAPAILLPGRPENDLQALLSNHGIVLAAQSGPGFEFV